MPQWTGSALVQIMACRSFGAKPLPEAMLAYCQLDCWEQISVKFVSQFHQFRSRKCIWTCRLPIWQPFCPGARWVKVNWTFWPLTQSYTEVYIVPSLSFAIFGYALLDIDFIWRHKMGTFPRYWPFVRGSHRWIPLTKASDAELWCFLWSSPEQTVE